MPKHLLNSNFRFDSLGIVVFAARILDNTCKPAFFDQFSNFECCPAFGIGCCLVGFTIDFRFKILILYPVYLCLASLLPDQIEEQQ